MSNSPRPPSSHFDFKDPAIWAAGVPHETIASLRRSTPVYWNDEEDGTGFWAVLRHEDIIEVSRRPDIFSSATANGGHRIFNENEVGLTGAGQGAVGIPFISMDPPDHQKYRMRLAPGFSARKLRELSARIEQRAKDLLGTLSPDAAVDWVETLAAPFPLMTLAELLGVPGSDWQKLYHWTNAFIGEDDPDFRTSPEDIADRMAEFGQYVAWLFEARRREPDDDLISALANAEIDGASVPFEQFMADMVLVTVGGNETVRNSISNGVMTFAQFPDQWALFCEHPELRPKAIEEVVRYVSPVLHMRRTATQDTFIGETAIAQGDKVVLWYVAGNRDEAAYPNPHNFDIRRSGTRHLGFGTGQHVCIGQRLAELQLQILFGEIAKRYSGFEITTPASRLRSNFINGIKSLQVRPVPSTR
jgi:linalool 8-monooxygenase